MLPIPLLQWYREHARDLPWRRTPDPYRVWVSEIMLQQTRVAAVLGYFARFMAAFPTIQDLADAPEDVLMKQWQGLGYYSRARNLQKAARQIMDEHGGVFPTDYPAIRALAGIGDYTAAAIASICFGQPVPAVDGNLLRVAARVLADDTDITTTQGKRHFTQALQAVIPVDFPGQFNQAMMDLGATVCLAHPMLQKLPEGWLEAFIERLLPCGLTAIEAYHSEHSEAASRRCLELARHYGLGVSGGSDYHGTNKPRIRLGKGYGSLRVPYSVLEELREMRARRGLPC